MKNRTHTTLGLALFALAVAAGNGHAQSFYTPYAFTNFAGKPAHNGSKDGTGDKARFYLPGGIVVDKAGTFFLTDFKNHTIRKMTSAGVVTTLAGLAGTPGTNDGIGAAARFDGPGCLDVDANGTLYVTDFYNHTIRQVTAAGVVTTLAGTPGVAGSDDGPASAALFNNPIGIALDSAGNLYVGDWGNNTIRKISPSLYVTTIAGSPGQTGSQDGPGRLARFNGPHHVRLDSFGNVYIADTGNDTIRAITPAGIVTTVAGLAGSAGSADGYAESARFNQPYGLMVAPDGTIYVADTGNNTIRRITPQGIVTTLAGLTGVTGSDDGIGSEALFNFPWSLTVDATGEIYVSDSNNMRITKGVPVLQVDSN